MPHQGMALCLGTCLVIAGCAGDAEDVGSPAPLVVQDVIYGHKLGMALTLDVHSAADPNGAGILLMNSGGWLSPRCQFLADEGEPLRLLTDAELDEAQPLCRELKPEYMASRGFTVFDVRHGSSPRFNVAEAAADVRRALEYVYRHASDYGVDPSRLGVWGGSAGGQLALMLGLSDAEEASSTGNADASVAAIVAYFPPHDLEALVAYSPQSTTRLPAIAIAADELRAVSPVHHASADDPPTLIIHGDEDELVPHASGEAMHQALQAVGVESEFLTLEGAPHGFTGAYADSALAASLAWFEAHLSR